MRESFGHFSRSAADYVGSRWAFLVAGGAIVAWSLSGPLVGFSDTWQLVINTATTIVTFLMVFLIQNTQNRDAMAIQLKLDELFRAVDAARTGLVDLESLNDEQLAQLKGEFVALSQKHCHEVAGDPIAAARVAVAAASGSAADTASREMCSA
jgi:low affinity Fe/Cu permease